MWEKGRHHVMSRVLRSENVRQRNYMRTKSTRRLHTKYKKLPLRKKETMGNIYEEYKFCPIRQVISKFGDKWSLLVLYQLYSSDKGIMRFNEIRGLMTDCSQKMLSSTLKRLEQSNLVNRKLYPEVPPRVEYSLTDTGYSLMPTITGLIEWAQAHFEDITNIKVR